MSDHETLAVLTPETVKQLRDAGPKDLVWLLCDSHELLRADLDETVEAYHARLREKSAAEAERDALAEALREAISWIEEEDPYEDPHDDVRLRFIEELRAPLARVSTQGSNR